MTRVSLEEEVKIFKQSIKNRFDIITNNWPKDWLNIKEAYIDYIKNDKQLTEEIKEDLIEFINKLETRE